MFSRSIFSSFFILLLATSGTVRGAEATHESQLQHTKEIHLQISNTCNEIWQQLSALKDEQAATAAAPSFAAAASRLALLDRELQKLEENELLDPESKQFMEQSSNAIIEAYVLLGREFGSIYATNCLGSLTLKKAFDEALRDGFFYVDQSITSDKPKPYFTKQEEEQELQRLKKLIHPDNEALKCLVKVQDEASAKQAATELGKPISILHSLRQQAELSNHIFHPSRQEQFLHARRPLEQILWQIRHQYVRIAANFAPNSNDFNTLANTLDELYMSMEETHTNVFAIVFDASFIADMDAAYEKQATLNSTP